jgi:centromeric protein E
MSPARSRCFTLCINPDVTYQSCDVIQKSAPNFEKKLKSENSRETSGPMAQQGDGDGGGDDAIKVVVRVRPREREDVAAWFACDGSRVTQLSGPNGRPLPGAVFAFDRVFGERATTQELYETYARPIAVSVLTGVNATIMAYGQTATGKTHTMSGSLEQPGVIPLVVHDIFARIGSTTRPESFFPSCATTAASIEFCIRVSMVEIYNEAINDLLNPAAVNLRILESDRGAVLECKEEVVTSPEQVLELMRRGEERRHVGSTLMNERSSRSHTIVRMAIESTISEEEEEDGETTAAAGDAVSGKIAHVSMLTLVDLAGSERIAHTGAEGMRKVEAGQINKSLLTLGTVINKLSEGGSMHIPFRDSKLTRLLQPSLGGNARTGIICTISLLQQHIEETLSTLKFASRAKKIENRAIVNEVLDTTTVIGNLKREIRLLKQKLTEQDDAKHREKSVREIETLARSIIATPARHKKQCVGGEGDHTAPCAAVIIAATAGIGMATPAKSDPESIVTKREHEAQVKQLRDSMEDAQRRAEDAEVRAAQHEETLISTRTEMEAMTKELTARIAEIQTLHKSIECEACATSQLREALSQAQEKSSKLEVDLA